MQSIYDLTGSDGDTWAASVSLKSPVAVANSTNHSLQTSRWITSVIQRCYVWISDDLAAKSLQPPVRIHWCVLAPLSHFGVQRLQRLNNRNNRVVVGDVLHGQCPLQRWKSNKSVLLTTLLFLRKQTPSRFKTLLSSQHRELECLEGIDIHHLTPAGPYRAQVTLNPFQSRTSFVHII